jgi:hypothetical protein
VQRFALILCVASSLATGCRTTSSSAVKTSEAALSPEDKAELPPFTPVLLSVPVDVKRSLASVHPDSQGFALQGTAAVEAAGAPSRYFVTMYGFQGTGPFNLPRFTHSFAYFVRVAGNDLATGPLEAFTISWDAADGDIGILQPVEPGHNYTLAETLALADSFNVNVQVRRSALLEINKTLYDKALARYFQLIDGEDTGAVRYRMIDTLASRQGVIQKIPGSYSNCIAAVADVLVGNGGALLNTGNKRGFAASEAILQWYLSSPYFINPSVGHDAVLAPRLGI